MEFDVITLFPELFEPMLTRTVLGRARASGIFQVHFHQIREFAFDPHRTVDDVPYGGGPGMIMKCEPLFQAWQTAQNRNPEKPALTVLFSPSGEPLKQASLASFAEGNQRLILVCGRYEGVDQRFIDLCVDLEVSLGDYILSGGEIPAMVLIDGIVRLLPGALGNPLSAIGESFSPANEGMLEFPQYTRPPVFQGIPVPEVLTQGNHKEIGKFRQSAARARTMNRRPDLINALDANGGHCSISKK